MAVLEVGRLHARYHDVDDAEARLLDEALRQVADDGLAASLLDVSLPDVHGVCIRSLHVQVELDPNGGRRALVGAWASAIVAALDDDLRAHGIAASTARGPTTSPDGSVVVYPREHDVVIDLVRSSARGDSSRAWAWQRCGILPTTAVRATGSDVVRLLASRPWLVPAVVRGAGPELAALLDVDGWIDVAHALARCVGAPTDAAAVPTTAPALPAPPAASVAAARAVLPDHVWRAAADRDRSRSLAVLAVACVAPALLRRSGTLDAVVHAAMGSDTPPTDASGSSAHDRAHLAAPPRATTEPSYEASDTTAAPEAPTSGTGEDHDRAPLDPAEETITTAWGGVLYLVHGITALDLPTSLAVGPLADLDGPTVLAHVLAGTSGAPVDDPAVRAAAGCPVAGDLEPLVAIAGAAAAQEVGHLVERLRAWLAERLEPDADPAWPWARPATLAVEPGWTEATFSLDDVDTRIRAAGLDLDPGFVWWLGSVVRFRHV